MKCPTKIWHSWILAVLIEFINKLISHFFLAFPPLFPKKPIDKIFFFFASFKTFKIFFELPEVDIQIKISFLFPIARKVLLKISSKL